jgi:Lrp/AsnC family leucine-responsive transcriptional regulator
MVELAKRVNLSATPCVKRVKRLEVQGIIKGYHARLAPEALGRSLLVFVQVSLTNTDEKTLDAFNQAMREIPDVLECHMLGGGFDYLVKLRTRDMQAYRHFLGHVLGALDTVETTHTYFVMEEVKESTLLPVAG